MTHPAINPELMLKAAQLAKPEIEWEVRPFTPPPGLGDPGDPVVCAKDYPNWYGDNIFAPLTNHSDAWALEDALIKSGWSHRWLPISKTFLANHKPWGCDSVTICPEADDSRSVLLLKCVSAMTGIPLHAKGVER